MLDGPRSSASIQCCIRLLTPRRFLQEWITGAVTTITAPGSVAHCGQVDLTKMPHSNRFRPDFMATGPHALIEKDKPLSFMVKSDKHDDEDEEMPSYRFYESEKILGKLFRAIDERSILASVQSDTGAKTFRPPGGAQSVLPSVWSTILRRCQARQCQLPQWERHLPRARGIRDQYVPTQIST